METILEQQRRYHEEKERLMDAKTKEMLHKKTTRYMDVCANLRDMYEDKDGMRKEELNAISGPNEFAEFYNRLKHIKEFHRKHPNEICVPMSVEFEELVKARENVSEEAQNLVEFTDEEGYGRYLDLHDCYLKFINLKGAEKLEYITYLSTFDQLFDIPKERKNAEYKKYLEMLLEYLQDYTDRVKPLLDQNELYEKILNEFEKKWENGTFPGWPELASLGLDRLKSALMALNLKCGGTLEERAQRLFSTKGKSMESLDPSLFAKNPKSKGPKKDTERNKEIGFLEAQIYEYVEILGEQRQLTHENVQRKQARTGEEREEEEEEQPSESESDDEDNEIIYNPKNLPLGWDGKPIPYWLYKLHGLNINYNCEICVGTILVSAQVMNTTTTLPTATSIQGTDVTSVSTATTAKVNSTLMMDNYTTSNTTSGIPSTPTTTTTIPPGLNQLSAACSSAAVRRMHTGAVLIPSHLR
ncbi:SF3A3 factor, partial [Polypterus senegalus]